MARKWEVPPEFIVGVRGIHRRSPVARVASRCSTHHLLRAGAEAGRELPRLPRFPCKLRRWTGGIVGSVPECGTNITREQFQNSAFSGQNCPNIPSTRCASSKIPSRIPTRCFARCHWAVSASSCLPESLVPATSPMHKMLFKNVSNPDKSGKYTKRREMMNFQNMYQLALHLDDCLGRWNSGPLQGSGILWQTSKSSTAWTQHDAKPWGTSGTRIGPPRSHLRTKRSFRQLCCCRSCCWAPESPVTKDFFQTLMVVWGSICLMNRAKP